MTRYHIEVSCDDLGEYDATFLADCAVAIATLLRGVGAVGFTVGTARQRSDEGPPPWMS